MRRPTSALAAAFLGTALVATTVSAQQNVPSLLGDAPASARASGALKPATPASSPYEAARSTSAAPVNDGAPPPLSKAVNPARTARTLVRNGWDYITYQEYDRALAFFKEADARKSELSDVDRARLKQGIAKAQQALRLANKGVKVDSAYALTDQKGTSRQRASDLAGRTMRQGDPMVAASRMKSSASQIPSALQAAMHEPDSVELPPLVDDRPRADDQISRASGDDAQAATTAVRPNPEPIMVPDASAEPLPEPSASPTMSPAAIDAPMPTPAASPDLPPVPALPPAGDLLAPEPAPPVAPETTPEPPPSAATMPSPAAIPAAESPASSSMPELPKPDASAFQAPSRSAAAPEIESLPPLPDTDDAPAPEAPGTPPPVEPSSSGNGNMDAAASAPPSERPEGPITAPDDLRMTPRGVFGRDTLIPERRAVPSQSSLSPELQREVEEVARQQEENTARDRATPNPPAIPNEEPIQGMPLGTIASRLEISRAPSSTEARPIRAIPVPEEFVPLPKREWNPNRKYWAAAATCHLPLYFQDASLERYGYSFEQRLGTTGRWFSFPIDDPKQSKQRNQILQPFASMGLFAIQIGLLPWNLIMDPPWEAEYDLGYYRPGDRVPADTFYLPLTGVGPPLHGRSYGNPKPGAASLPASRW